MAYFVYSKETKVWAFLEPTKIDLSNIEGPIELEKLKSENEFVRKVPFHNVTNIGYALVDGAFFEVNRLARLKYLCLQEAIKSKMSPVKLSELLEPYSSGGRKTFLLSVEAWEPKTK